jgi:hypothetical protein
MKKNKKLPILIGAAILIYFLLPKKSTSGGGGTADNTSAPSNQLMRLKQNNKVLTTLNQSTRKPADVNGIIN